MDIRSRSDRFFLCKVMVNATTLDGMRKKVLNQYLIDAGSWAEAERRILQYLSAYIDSEDDLRDMSIAKYDEIFFQDKLYEKLWYSAKMDYIFIDDWTGKEKRKTHLFLLPAESLDGANKLLGNILKETMEDYIKTEIKDSGICEVIEYNDNVKYKDDD